MIKANIRENEASVYELKASYFEAKATRFGLETVLESLTPRVDSRAL